MQYKVQLEQPEWLTKRKQILNRDSHRCVECSNQSYQQAFSSGLIFNNRQYEKILKSVLHNENFIVNIWDMRENRIQTAFIKRENFNPDKSYVAFYELSGKYANIVGLKNILDERIELSPSILDIVRLGIKGRVTNRTFDSVYEIISPNDTWNYIKGLHVHHTYYQEGKLAWQYDQSALQTLCWVCHEKLHKNKTVPVLDSNGNAIGLYTNCKRCAGAGYFPEFYYVNSGICFRCDGNRFEELRPNR